MIYNNKTFQEMIEGEKLTFLIGAGCSIDAPSCLPSGREMIKQIIKHTCAESEVDKLLGINNIRFEYLVEIVRDGLDKNLRIIDYYGLCDKPNLQHFFLDEMLKKGHFVMTTNFDYLIEYAVLQSGISKGKCKVVITKNDFKEYEDPNILLNQEILAIYKIHGSPRNIIDNENTKDSLIVTLQAFGEGKEGDSVFQLEPYKRPLFENISKGRTLVVMGYSGSDDFDVVPTLKILQEIKKVIWINHIDESNKKEKITEILNNDEKSEKLDKIGKILVEIKRMGYVEHIYRIDGNTGKIIKGIIGDKPQISDEPFEKSASKWLDEVVHSPKDYKRYIIPYKIYKDFSYSEDAMRCAKKILGEAEKNGDVEWKAETINQIGLLLYEKGEFDKGLKYFNTALAITKELNDISKRAAILNNIAQIYVVKGKPDEALSCYKQTIIINEQLGELKNKSKTLNNIASILIEKGNLKNALKHYNEGLKIDEQIGNLYGKALKLNNIGNLLRQKGDLYGALENYKEALAIVENLGNLRGKSHTLHNLGILLEKKGDLKNALDYFQEALKIDEKLGNLIGKTNKLNSIGLILMQKGDLKNAFTHLKKALSIDEQLGNLSGKSRELNSLGNILIRKGDLEGAVELLEKALAINKKLGNLKNYAITLNNIGGILFLQNKYQEALEKFIESLKIRTQLGVKVDMAQSNWWIGGIYSKSGQWEKALKYFKTAMELYKDVGLTQKVKKLQTIIDSLSKN